MINTIKAAFLWAAAALICIAVLMMNSEAAVIIDYDQDSISTGGPGAVSDSGEDLSIEESRDEEGFIANIPAAAANGSLSTSGVMPADEGINYTSHCEDGTTVYTFEGKEYTAGASYGVHRLSGYSSDDTGTAGTTSGSAAAARHTLAAASDLELGTCVIIKGLETTEYDGMYVVEDRGGYYVESEKWLDIYFGTAAEAQDVTSSGWQYAEAWIAVPVQ